MEKIENATLANIIKSHRGAMQGDESQKLLKRGFLYEKQIEDFVFCSTEGLTDQPIQGSEFNNCVFNKVDLYYSQFYGSVFKNCVFINCSFVKSEMLKITLNNCTFTNCNLFRVIMSGHVNQCVFKDCNLENMILTETQIINTIFTGETALPNASDNEEHNVIWDIKSPVLV